MDAFTAAAIVAVIVMIGVVCAVAVLKLVRKN
jgi:hypothetical protein